MFVGDTTEILAVEGLKEVNFRGESGTQRVLFPEGLNCNQTNIIVFSQSICIAMKPTEMFHSLK